MFVPHKPWPFRNELHSISCSDSGILSCVDLFEGEDSQEEYPQKISREREICVFNIAPHKNDTRNR